jgi:hypothetical protein
MPVAQLSFTVSLASSWDDLAQAAAVRAASYGHHIAELRSVLAEPDDVDLDPGTVVFVCEDKASGKVVGTARVQTSIDSNLLVERAVGLPAEILDHGRAEITRLASVQGADPLVKLALMKAGYLYCLANQVRWLVIGARKEALIRQYMRLGFADVFGDSRRVALAYAGGLPHRILKFDVTAAEREWFARRHPLYGFMKNTVHPDIELFVRPRIARYARALAA